MGWLACTVLWVVCVIFLVFRYCTHTNRVPKNVLALCIENDAFTLYCNNYPCLFVVLARFY